MNTQQDVSHCGACDQLCPPQSFCVQGKCQRRCPSSLNTCNTTCVDLQADNQHCGQCKQSCATGEQCQDGQCIPLCPNNNILCNGSCVDLETNHQHCGGCAQACKFQEVCTQGRCQILCPPNTTFCDAACRHINTDIQHCGRCNNACRKGEQCSQGQCTCPKPKRICKGQCVDLQQDRKNCGQCGQSCPAQQACIRGQCLAPCPTSTTRCGNQCVDMQNNPRHCGACLNDCGSGYICGRGRCIQHQQDTLLSSGSTEPPAKLAVLDAKSGPFGEIYRIVQVQYTDREKYLLIRLNSEASQSWQVDMPAPQNTKAPIFEDPKQRYIHITTSGKVYLFGHFSAPIERYPGGQQRLIPQAEIDSYLREIDPETGQERKLIQLRSSGTLIVHALTSDAQENLYIAGEFSKTFTLSNSTLQASSKRDAFVAKLSPEGTLIWAQKLGGLGDDRAVQIQYAERCPTSTQQKPQPCLYLTGTYNAEIRYGIHNLKHHGKQDIFVARISTLGTFEWSRSFGGREDEEALRLFVEDATNPLLIGTFRGDVVYNRGMLRYTASSKKQFFATKFLPKGDIQWSFSTAIPSFSTRCQEGPRDFALYKDALYATGAFVILDRPSIFLMKIQLFEQNGSIRPRNS
ncbi:MAG: MXAN_6577-like cysteine-rich protein, partial [Myxococcota bacterium]